MEVAACVREWLRIQIETRADAALDFDLGRYLTGLMDISARWEEIYSREKDEFTQEHLAFFDEEKRYFRILAESSIMVKSGVGIKAQDLRQGLEWAGGWLAFGRRPQNKLELALIKCSLEWLFPKTLRGSRSGLAILRTWKKRLHNPCKRHRAIVDRVFQPNLDFLKDEINLPATGGYKEREKALDALLDSGLKSDAIFKM